MLQPRAADFFVNLALRINMTLLFRFVLLWQFRIFVQQVYVNVFLLWSMKFIDWLISMDIAGFVTVHTDEFIYF